MKKLKALLLAFTLSSIACAAGGLAACTTGDNGGNGGGGDNGGGTDNEQSQYVMKITAIGSTTIQVDKTVTLRTQVTGTNQKDVTKSEAKRS